MDKNLLVDSWINKLAGIHEYQILCARTIDSTLTGITEWMELSEPVPTRGTWGATLDKPLLN